MWNVFALVTFVLSFSAFRYFWRRKTMKSETTTNPEDYSQLFLQKEKSDLKLLVGDKKYFVHKCVLAAKSKYFQKLFVKIGKFPLHKVDLRSPNDVEYLLRILRYMYHGVLQFRKDMTLDQYMDMLHYIHQFEMIENLEEELTKMVKQIITEKNVLDVFFRSTHFHFMKKQCIEYIYDHFDEIEKDVRLYRIRPDDFCDILEAMTALLPEIRKFTMIKKWIWEHQDDRNAAEIRAQVLSRLEFTRLSMRDLKKTVEPSNVFDNDLFQKILNTMKLCGVQGKISSLTLSCHGRISISYSDTAIVTEYEKDTYYCVFDLGSCYKINHLKFYLDQPARYWVEYSKNGNKFTKILDYTDHLCKKQQTLYFDEVEAGFIKICSAHGDLYFGSVNVSNEKAIAHRHGQYLYPRKNFATPDRAIAIGGCFAVPELFSWDGTTDDAETPYVSIKAGVYKHFEIYFFQPIWTGSCRILLWDDDSRKYHFRVGCKSDNDDNILCDEIAYINFNHESSEQIIQFEPRPVMVFIIEAIDATIGDELRLVLFETPAQHLPI